VTLSFNGISRGENGLISILIGVSLIALYSGRLSVALEAGVATKLKLKS